MKKIKFPQDELAHNHIIEWWYFNGHLKDKMGNKYAFMNCLFRANTKKVKIPFLERIPTIITNFYHSTIVDIGKKKNFPTADLFSAVSADSFSKPLLFINHINPSAIIGNYTNRVLEETKLFEYILKDENVDLKLISTKKPLLEGGGGLINVHSKKSYYYSLTNIKTAGKIRINNKWIEVTGKSWMDHQWANASYTKDRWSWFSIQLDDNREIVCYEYKDKQVKTYLADISYKDGKTEHLEKIIFTPLGKTWKSTKTEAVYPTKWNIEIPGKNINLEVEAMNDKQEIIFGSINYWEGPISVLGFWEGKPVKGDGFMELVGYPSKYSNIKYLEDKFKETVGATFSFAKKNIFHF